ncbi:hypothetical protein A4X06_0g3790 [Tilletia controversa]|uniref:Uncharacterized protein n=1 Tax=Tilletia controversa TaxID=13291 RepID=A0A8X7MTV0_9BASI|nr:hypothetical protein A4X06_0g3790 [Tilletia controversa]
MFVLIRLTPLDGTLPPSDIFLHPLLEPEHLDDFSLPISFPVNAQAQLHIHEGQPVIYCQYSSCDVLQNGIPASKKPRRVYTGDSFTVLSSDAPTSISATYTIEVAYFSFSSDLRREVSVELKRLQSSATLALQADTSSGFPLLLPLEGDLPAPAPRGTNWNGVQDLINGVRTQSARTGGDPSSRGPTSAIWVVISPLKRSQSVASPRTPHECTADRRGSFF